MLNKIDFQFEAELKASELNSVNEAIADGINAVGLIQGELYTHWYVLEDESINFDSVYTQDRSTRRFYDITNPMREGNIDPAFWVAADIYSLDDNDYMYIGHNHTFEEISINIILISGGSNLTWEYWSGGSWDVIPGLVDGTGDFNNGGTNSVTFTAPTDWVLGSLNEIEATGRADNNKRYWVRVTVGTATSFNLSFIKRVKLTTTNNRSLKVEPTSPASLSVVVNPGVAIIDGTWVTVRGIEVLGITTPGSDKYYAAVQLTKSGEVVIDYGPSAASPVQKNTRIDAIKLADILVDTADTEVSSVVDQRTFLT